MEYSLTNPKFRILIALFLVSILILLLTAWISDDAFITLRTVDNWRHGYGITWNVSERVQTYTHPLWMFLLAGLYIFIPNGYFTAIILSLLTSVAVMAIFLHYQKEDLFTLVFGWAILIFSKAFVDYSTSGLENPLANLLLLLFAIEFLKSDCQINGRKSLLLAFIAGLATLNRMDSLLFFLPALIYLFIFEYHNWHGLAALAAGFLPFLLWELFSIFYYGFLFPNSAYAKLNVDISRSDLLHQGALYFLNSITHDPITLFIPLIVLVLSTIYRNTKIRLLAFGMVLYLAYVFYIGGDFMSGRFFSETILLSTILLLQLARGFSMQRKYIFAGAVLILGLLPSFSSLWASQANNGIEGTIIDPSSGIADERLFYFFSNGLVNMDGKMGLPDNIWVDLGKQYREEGYTVRMVAAAGMVGYFAGPNVHIVDKWAICDPLLSRIRFSNLDWRIGHFTRSFPDGYIETLQTGQNKIKNPSLAQYYDKLKIIISGDLWSWDRIKTIWNMNTGKYDDLINGYVD